MATRSNNTNRTQTQAAQTPAPQEADAVQPTAAVDVQPEVTAAAPLITESDETVTESDTTADAPAPADPTAALFAVAVSPTASQDQRRGALAALLTQTLRAYFAQVRALPDDQPLLADLYTRTLPGWSGRGPAASRASLTIALAALGAGNYFGQCHDNTGKTPIDVRLVLPQLLAPRFLEIFDVMHADNGYIRTAEKIAQQAGRDALKAGKTVLAADDGTLVDVTRPYQNLNVRSRKAMETAARKLGAQVAAAIPADDPDLDVIRRTLAVVAAEAGRLQGQKYFAPPRLADYAAKQELAPAVGASA